MKLPEMQIPELPRTANMQNVMRVEESSRQQLAAINQVSNAFRKGLDTYQTARDRADQTEARTRSILYEREQEELYREMQKEWVAKPLDRNVDDFKGEFTKRRETLRNQYVSEASSTVGKYMHDPMLVTDARVDLNADVFAVEQHNSRTIHQTMVSDNATANRIFDDPEDAFYELNVQNSTEHIEAMLTHVPPDQRSKLVRDMWNEFTVNYVLGMVNDGNLDGAMSFLEKDDRADMRLYRKDQLYQKVLAEGRASGEKSKVLINELYSEVLSDTMATGTSDQTNALIQALGRYGGTKLADREWVAIMGERINQLGEIAQFAAAAPDIHSMNTEEVKQRQQYLTEHAEDPNATRLQREYAQNEAARLSKDLTERQNDPTAWLATHNSEYGASIDQLSKMMEGVVDGTVPAAAAGAIYASLRQQQATKFTQFALDPTKAAAVLPENHPLDTMFQQWTEEKTGPDDTYSKLRSLVAILGPDAHKYLAAAQDPSLMAIAGTDDPVEANKIATGWSLDSATSNEKITNAALKYMNGLDLGPNSKSKQAEIIALYKYEFNKKHSKDSWFTDTKEAFSKTEVDESVLRRVTEQVIGNVPQGSYSPVGSAIESFQENGKMVSKGEIKRRVDRLAQPDTNWEEFVYIPPTWKQTQGQVDYRPHVGGHVVKDPSEMQDKISLLRVGEGIYQIVLKNSAGPDQEDGFVHDSIGRPLLVDFRKVKGFAAPQVNSLYDLYGKD